MTGWMPAGECAVATRPRHGSADRSAGYVDAVMNRKTSWPETGEHVTLTGLAFL